MTQQEIEYMYEDLKNKEEAEGGGAWMWFGLTEKLMLSDATKRKEIENLTFIECSELLMLWDKREEEMRRDREKQNKELNKNKLRSI